MVLNSYFTKEELITQLKMQFSLEEQEKIDFNQFKLTEVNDKLICTINGRKFIIHKILGGVLGEL